MEAPLITIFVRPRQDCKYVGDEFCKRCRCNKHLRWSMHGKQYRKKTGSRSWAGAEDAKRALEAQLTGKDPVIVPEGRLLSEAIQTFEDNKKAQGHMGEQIKAAAFDAAGLRSKGHMIVTASAQRLPWTCSVRVCP